MIHARKKKKDELPMRKMKKRKLALKTNEKKTKEKKENGAYRADHVGNEKTKPGPKELVWRNQDWESFPAAKPQTKGKKS